MAKTGKEGLARRKEGLFLGNMGLISGKSLEVVKKVLIAHSGSRKTPYCFPN